MGDHQLYKYQIHTFVSKWSSMYTIKYFKCKFMPLIFRWMGFEPWPTIGLTRTQRCVLGPTIMKAQFVYIVFLKKKTYKQNPKILVAMWQQIVYFQYHLWNRKLCYKHIRSKKMRKHCHLSMYKVRKIIDLQVSYFQTEDKFFFSSWGGECRNWVSNSRSNPMKGRLKGEAS